MCAAKMVLAHLKVLLDGQLGPKKVKSADLFIFMCAEAAIRLTKVSAMKLPDPAIQIMCEGGSSIGE